MSSYDAAIIDVTILEDPRLQQLPRSTRLMQVEAYVWSRAVRTDGHIPRHMLPRIVFDDDDREAAAASLVEVGLWQCVADGWQIVDFLKTQMSRERVERKRQLASDRWDQYQESKKDGKRVDKRVGKRVGNATEPTRTDLTRPDPTRQGREGEGRRAAAPRGGDLRSREERIVIRSREERIAISRQLLADPATHEPARRAAMKQLTELGEEP